MCMSTPSMPDFPDPLPPNPPPPAPPAPIMPDNAGVPAPTPVVTGTDSGNVKAKSTKRSAQQQKSQGTGSLSIPMGGTPGAAAAKGGSGLSIPT
jgi:hypothetical protein